MCVTDLGDIYTGLDCAGFGWKVIDRKKTGGLFASIAGKRYHEYKWNIAKNGSNSEKYDRGFHIPLTKEDLIRCDMDDIKYCIEGKYINYPVLVYVEYKEGHTLGEDYGPCIVANKMRIIDMYILSNKKLIKLKKGLGKNWLKDIVKGKEDVKISKKKN